MESPYVCSDCGNRQGADGKCSACGSDPMLDLRNPVVVESLLEDDRRRKEDRESKVMWVAIPSAMVVVVGLSLTSKFIALLLAQLPFFSGFILAMVFLALGVMKGFAVVFPFKPRFPYLRV